jgi:integrase
MGIYKRGDIYWYKFMFRGKLVRESTRQGNDKKARNQEAAHRLRLSNGEVGIREKKAAPTLREFLKADFLTFAETAHAAKPRTLRYYKQGADMLSKSGIAGLQIDQISDKNSKHFAAEHAKLSPSGINRGLRTLRRALNLAYEWGQIDKLVKIKLAPGENQRDRVLSETESEKYLRACPQPWRDCATLIIDEGFRPGEVFALQWPHILFDDDHGLIKIVEGKSKAARRTLPMTPRVFALLKARHESAGRPDTGWLFPSGGREGHFNGDVAKGQHAKALADSGVEPFEPYVLRHTALTRLAANCNDDPFVVMKIAGHSSITITQRYIHPQAEAIGRAFASLVTHRPRRKGPKRSQLLVGTKLGTVPKTRLLKAHSQNA